MRASIRTTSWVSPVLWATFALVCTLCGVALLRACSLQAIVFNVNFCPRAGSEYQEVITRSTQLLRTRYELDDAIATKAFECASLPPPELPALALPTFTTPSLTEGSANSSRPEQTAETNSENLALKGELEVRLIWEGPADLDLHVICPRGQEIRHNSKQQCGGTLDVDMNANGQRSLKPVERIYWPAGQVPVGTFIVKVELYTKHEDKRQVIPFTVRVKDGDATKIVSSTASANGQIEILRFNHGN